MAKNSMQIIVWEICSSIDVTAAHRTNYCLEVEHGLSDVKGAFDLDGSLFIAHASGVWHVRIKTQKY